MRPPHLRLVQPAAAITQIKIEIARLEQRRFDDLKSIAAHIQALKAMLSPEDWCQWVDERGNTEREMREFLRLYQFGVFCTTPEKVYFSHMPS